jgi:hypothetical protein
VHHLFCKRPRRVEGLKGAGQYGFLFVVFKQ